MASRARTLVIATTVALTALGAPAPAQALPAPAPPSPAAPARTASVARPGRVGAPILLQQHAQFHGHDVATDAAGNAYVGWIANTGSLTSATRAVHLCTLHPGSTTCAGGVRVVSGLDGGSAAGLRVLVTPAGKVTLVWYHDAIPEAVNGPRGGRIAVSTSRSGGPLSAPEDVADAPSFGELLDAEYGPGGAIWTIAAKGVGTPRIEVRRGVTHAPGQVRTPYSVGSAQLAFAGSVPIMAITRYGSISTPVSYAHGVGAHFSAFRKLAGTWTVGTNAGVVATRSGVRLVTAVGNADYFPVVSAWKGGRFSPPHVIGDRSSCAPTSHDLATDASGRLADVGDECGKITVANLPRTSLAGLARFSAGGVVADGAPQLATTPRGHAFVTWAVTGTGGNRLMLARVLLPGRGRTVSRISGKGRVTLTGPTSCQPASTITVRAKGKAVKGWRVAKVSLRFGGRTLGARATIDGSKLTPGKLYGLGARVVFRKGGSSRTGTESLTFRSCDTP